MECVWRGFTARIATHYSASPGQRAQRVVMRKPVTAASPPRITKGFLPACIYIFLGSNALTAPENAAGRCDA
jgi:hypothetical protein